MTALEFQERKRAWRRLISDLFTLVPSDARRKLDRDLTAKLGDYLADKNIRLLLGFSPLLDEPDISPFLRSWLAGGGDLAMPQWLGGASLSLRRVGDVDRDLRLGRAGILEPDPALPEVRPEELDLVVTPGRAFSEARVRMGRGSGCYDALFRRHRPFRLGVAYDFQIFPELPAYSGDMPMDAIVTPSRIMGQI
ncbi:MAG: 5-formyltetrahydrofolate cyclo-ligase [Planctomycetes bacterium]|nr:5-formyltetrahydrofolate cyclo-ligase [Planctomycetota bacterium]